MPYNMTPIIVPDLLETSVGYCSIYNSINITSHIETIELVKKVLYLITGALLAIDAVFCNYLIIVIFS